MDSDILILNGDEVDHVSRAQTSIHLAEQLTGDRTSIRCTLGDRLIGRADTRRVSSSITVFSPFGLGILDVAVGKFPYDLARKANVGSIVQSFFPQPWTERLTTRMASGK